MLSVPTSTSPEDGVGGVATGFALTAGDARLTVVLGAAGVLRARGVFGFVTGGGVEASSGVVSPRIDRSAIG
jgi:hypothetical protein